MISREEVEATVTALASEAPEAYDLLAFSAVMRTTFVQYEPYWQDLWRRRTGEEYEKWWFEMDEGLEEESRLKALLETLSAHFEHTFGNTDRVMSLVEYTHHNHWYLLRGAIGDVVRERLTVEERHAMEVRVVQCLLWSWPNTCYGWPYMEDWRRLETRYEHMAECSEWIAGVMPLKAISLLKELGRELASERRFAECEGYFQRALALAEALGRAEGRLETQDQHIASVCGAYGCFLERFGRYVEAEPLRRREMSIYEVVHPPNGKPVLSPEYTRRGLGLNLQQQGRHEEALPLLKNMLDWAIAKQGESSHFALSTSPSK